MDPVIKNDWTGVLRANPQRQDTGHLAAIYADGVERRCCLGELCELAVIAGVICRREVANNAGQAAEDPWPEPLSHHVGPPPVTVVIYGIPGSAGDPGDESTMGLPRAVADWAGLDSCDPEIAPDLPASLANDGHEMTFSAIADLVQDYC